MGRIGTVWYYSTALHKYNEICRAHLKVRPYLTVTDLARLRGMSGLWPRLVAM